MRIVPSAPDVEPRGINRELDSSEVSSAVLRFAQSLGFVRSGIAELYPYSQQEERLEKFLAQGRGADLQYLSLRGENGRLLRADPLAVFPEALAVICVALPYQAPQITALRRSRHEGPVAVDFDEQNT